MKKLGTFKKEKVEEEEKDCEKLCKDVVLAQWELK